MIARNVRELFSSNCGISHFTKLVASMRLVEGPFRVPKFSLVLASVYRGFWLAKNSFLLVFYVFDQNCQPWRPPRRCDASTCPMAESIGFKLSPGVLHWAMCPSSQCRIRMVVEMVVDLPAFFVSSISLLAKTIS